MPKYFHNTVPLALPPNFELIWPSFWGPTNTTNAQLKSWSTYTAEAILGRSKIGFRNHFAGYVKQYLVYLQDLNKTFCLWQNWLWTTRLSGYWHESMRFSNSRKVSLFQYMLDIDQQENLRDERSEHVFDMILVRWRTQCLRRIAEGQNWKASCNL